jgi:hypothetical protein
MQWKERANFELKPPLSAVFTQMPSDYTIYTAVYTNGVAILGIATIKMLPAMTKYGRPILIVPAIAIASYAGVVGGQN